MQSSRVAENLRSLLGVIAPIEGMDLYKCVVPVLEVASFVGPVRHVKIAAALPPNQAAITSVVFGSNIPQGKRWILLSLTAIVKATAATALLFTVGYDVGAIGLPAGIVGNPNTGVGVATTAVGIAIGGELQHPVMVSSDDKFFVFAGGTIGTLTVDVFATAIEVDATGQ